MRATTNKKISIGHQVSFRNKNLENRKKTKIVLSAIFDLNDLLKWLTAWHVLWATLNLIIGNEKEIPKIGAEAVSLFQTIFGTFKTLYLETQNFAGHAFFLEQYIWKSVVRFQANYEKRGFRKISQTISGFLDIFPWKNLNYQSS